MVVETKSTVNKNNENTLSSTVITTGNIFTNENKDAFFCAHRRYLFIATRDLSGALKYENHTRSMKTVILHGIHLVYGITYHLQQRNTIKSLFILFRYIDQKPNDISLN